MAKRRVQLGATGENVRRNLAAVRRSRSGGGPLTIRALADRLNDAGARTAHSALSEIENGARRVDVDDLTALAAALEVSPLSLLLPQRWHEGDAVELTGVGELPVSDAWAWMRDSVLPVEVHDDEPGYRRDVLRALSGEPVEGAPSRAALELAAVVYNRLLELGAIDGLDPAALGDEIQRFGRFRRHLARMMREFADAEGIADRLSVDAEGDDGDVLTRLHREWAAVMRDRERAVENLARWTERRVNGVIEATRRVAPERIRSAEVWIGLLDQRLDALRADFYGQGVNPPDETRRQLTAEEVAEQFPDHPVGWVAWEKARERYPHDDIRLELTDSGWKVHRGDG
ncbi:helix-turn-helix domain-containing protein [Cellulosimicrobium sp. RS]|uniref:helix-turn-helix domain-containing protein n=1 Tax=Cellulosimicrobium sp. RS TaxID=3381347 RepID=UPI0038FD0AA9